jgi:hypothetical protein
MLRPYKQKIPLSGIFCFTGKHGAGELPHPLARVTNDVARFSREPTDDSTQQVLSRQPKASNSRGG